jgi:hypothetical protein
LETRADNATTPKKRKKNPCKPPLFTAIHRKTPLFPLTKRKRNTL